MSYGFQLGQQAGDTPFIGSANQTTPGSLTNPPTTGAGTLVTCSLANIMTNIENTFLGAVYIRAEQKNNIAANVWQTINPVNAPAAPTLSTVSAGSLTGQGTIYAAVTYVNAYGETTASTAASLAVANNTQLVVASPSSTVTSPAGSGPAPVTGWNVYLGASSSTLKKQNASPLTLGSNYQLATAVSTSGAATPSLNTSAPMKVNVGKNAPTQNEGQFAYSDNISLNANGVNQQFLGNQISYNQVVGSASAPVAYFTDGRVSVMNVLAQQGTFNEHTIQAPGTAFETYADYYSGSRTARLDHLGTLYLANSGIALGSSPSAQSLTTGATVTVFVAYSANSSYPIPQSYAPFGASGGGAYHWGKVRLTATANVTGLILQASVANAVTGGNSAPSDGTETTLVNESAYTLTFAATGSNVAMPSLTILAGYAQKFVWNAGAQLWYAENVAIGPTGATGATGATGPQGPAGPAPSGAANQVLATPNGASGVSSLRALVAADIPTLNQNTTGTAANVSGTVALTNGGTGATTAAAALTNLFGSFQNWTPTITPLGSMTASGITITDAQYLRLGPIVHFKINITLTLGGTLDVGIYISLPSGLSLVGQNSAVQALLNEPGTSFYRPAHGRTDPTNGLLFKTGQTGNFQAGQNILLMSGFYRCA